MTKTEWDAIATWLLGLFPAWNPDAYTLNLWFKEIPKEITSGQVVTAVRVLQSEKATTLPPNIFEILSKIRGKSPSQKIEAKKVFESILEHVRRRGTSTPIQCDEFTRKVLTSCGGTYRIGNSTDNEIKWLEKEFIESWLDLKSSELVMFGNRNENRVEIEGGTNAKI